MPTRGIARVSRLHQEMNSSKNLGHSFRRKRADAFREVALVDRVDLADVDDALLGESSLTLSQGDVTRCSAELEIRGN